jgi:hypothetical protein
VFIINEWLWADLTGENENQGPRQVQAVRFIGALLSQVSHQVIFIEGSTFQDKATAACGSTHLGIKQTALDFMIAAGYDATRFRRVQEHKLKKLPQRYSQTVEAGDRYLVRALVTYDDAILVTTDPDLRDALNDMPGRCILRAEFYETYFGMASIGADGGHKAARRTSRRGRR